MNPTPVDLLYLRLQVISLGVQFPLAIFAMPRRANTSLLPILTLSLTNTLQKVRELDPLARLWCDFLDLKLLYVFILENCFLVIEDKIVVGRRTVSPLNSWYTFPNKNKLSNGMNLISIITKIIFAVVLA